MESVVEIEHKPWIGPGYTNVPKGQRIAILGYSYHGEETDYEDFTIETLVSVLNGENIAFFKKIPDYFGQSLTFWNDVLFFNFLPDIVGDGENRYGSGTTQQIIRGKARFLRLVEQHAPDKIFVFSKRAWRQLPPKAEETKGLECEPISEEMPSFQRGSYRGPRGSVSVFGLRHPQFARDDEMKQVIKLALERDPGE